MLKFLSLPIAAFAALPLAVSAQTESLPTLASHVHGVATLSVVVENNNLNIELDTPAINILGFEHEAKSVDEQNKVKEATKTLNDPATLFGVKAAAKCTLNDADIDFALGEQHDHPHDDEDDDHDHDHGGHGDIEASYKFTCTAINQLSGLDLKTFFSNFAQTEKINVQLISPKGQSAIELNPSKTSFNW